MTTTIRVTEEEYYQIQQHYLRVCRTNGWFFDSSAGDKWLAEKYKFPLGTAYRIEVSPNPKEKP